MAVELCVVVVDQLEGTKDVLVEVVEVVLTAVVGITVGTIIVDAGDAEAIVAETCEILACDTDDRKD